MFLRRKRRQRILAQIHTTWIKGLLEPSLATVPYIPLPLQSWTIEDAYKSSLPIPILSPELIDVYHTHNHRLLLLGDEGAGKTTVLLELLRDLLQRAEQDENAPIPVMFHLSSWTTKCQPLEKWLDEEWNTFYQGMGFKAGKLLLLLDGFDTIREELQSICFQTIMAYQNTYTHIPLVLCCRNNDYERFQSPEKAHSVVQILPLSEEQINTYISNASCDQVAVRKALASDANLHALSHRPLPLAMLTALYRGSSQVDIVGSDQTECLHKLCAAYIQRELMSEQEDDPQTALDTRRQLTWLAGHLWQDQITGIHLEQFWPRWLPSRRWVLLYRLLMSFMTLAIFMLIVLDKSINWDYRLALFCFGLVAIFFLSRQPIDSTTQKIFFRGGWLWLALGHIPEHIPVPRAIDFSWPWVLVLVSGLVFVWMADTINKLFDEFVFPFRGWITRAGRSATLSGLLMILVVTIFEVIRMNGTGMFSGLHQGLFTGLCFLMATGGDVFLEHWIIRFCFWRAGSIPWRYRAFLDAQVEHKILFRIGNSYLFRQQSFLRYFASLQTKSLDQPHNESPISYV